MKFLASIYQKMGNNTQNPGETSFHYSINGTTDKKDVPIKEIAKLFARKVMKVAEQQQRLQNKGIKARFYNLAKSKPLYFWFEVEGRILLDSEIFESLKVRISDAETRDKLETLLHSVMTIVSEQTDTI